MKLNSKLKKLVNILEKRIEVVSNLVTKASVSFILLISLIVPMTSNASLIFDYDDRALTLNSIKNISVNGMLYDVMFERDTCAALFSGCDELSDFPFTLSTGGDFAVSFKNAIETLLLQESLISVRYGPERTLRAVTPTAFTSAGFPFLRTTEFDSEGSTTGIGDLFGGRSTLDEIVSSGYFSYAVWTPSQKIESVSAPGTAGLLILSSLMVFRKRVALMPKNVGKLCLEKRVK